MTLRIDGEPVGRAVDVTDGTMNSCSLYALSARIRRLTMPVLSESFFKELQEAHYRRFKNFSLYHLEVSVDEWIEAINDVDALHDVMQSVKSNDFISVVCKLRDHSKRTKR